MRVHMPYLTQPAPGRHRAAAVVYVRTNAYDLTGQRRAVAQLPARFRKWLHDADETLERARGLR